MPVVTRLDPTYTGRIYRVGRNVHVCLRACQGAAKLGGPDRNTALLVPRICEKVVFTSVITGSKKARPKNEAPRKLPLNANQQKADFVLVNQTLGTKYAGSASDDLWDLSAPR
jgi:hypothetical protein